MARPRLSRQLTLLSLMLTMTAFNFACLRRDEAPRTARELESPDLQSRFLAVEGDVEYRRGHRGAWRKARVDATLEPGDWVKTAGDGRAEICFPDGTTYELRPDTLVHLSSLLDSRPDVEAIPDFAWVDPHDSPPACPRLVSPAGDLEIDFETQKVLRLAWEGVPAASRYALHVSRSRSFDSKVIEDAERRKPSAKIGIRGEGTFYWRVAAYEADGFRGAWSEVRSFRIL